MQVDQAHIMGTTLLEQLVEEIRLFPQTATSIQQFQHIYDYMYTSTKVRGDIYVCRPKYFPKEAFRFVMFQKLINYAHINR